MMNATPPVQQQAAQVNQPNMPNPPQGTDPASVQAIQGQKPGPV